jgi:sugar lactone lactonase YvrE
MQPITLRAGDAGLVLTPAVGGSIARYWREPAATPIEWLRPAAIDAVAQRDGRTMYHADTARRTVWAWDFDPDAGAIANRRTFLEVPAADGAPDGATVDAEGLVWLAHWGGWRLTRLDPAGRVERVVRLPVQQPTCPAFGGPDLDVLYVTSASITLTAEARARQPWAGGILALDPGVRGLPEARFRG